MYGICTLCFVCVVWYYNDSGDFSDVSLSLHHLHHKSAFLVTTCKGNIHQIEVIMDK